MAATTASTGSAERWGPLWGARARDWAMNEERQRPTYEAAIRRVTLSGGERVLEVGCGTGVFLELASARGADVAGLDAAEALLAIARERVPGAELRQGDMESLPWPDASFDLVAGFNSYFFAADMVAALRESARVARPGAPVVIQVWGDPERCALEATKRVIRSYMPAPPPDAPAPPKFHEPGVLEGIAAEAGLEPKEVFDLSWAYEYEDEETLGCAMLAPMGVGEVVGPEREDVVRRELVDSLAACRRDDGSYSIPNEFRFLIARAPG
jgi:SAM-dependent methyltransferase